MTALFADLSGFSSITAQLDPEQLLEIIDPVLTVLANVVARYDGYIEKFAGDAVLALFGAPVAHEDDAVRALLAAMDMREELAEVVKSLPDEAAGLSLHIGVNTGHVIARLVGSKMRTDYAVLGDAVVVAQRLEGAAPSGEIYVGGATVRLSEQRFVFEPLGELTLKGKIQGLQGWRLIRKRPETLRRYSAALSSLVGREREIEILDRAFKELSRGHGGLITISGEPGVGKTALTLTARGRAEGLGIRWVQARCTSYGAVHPYLPYAELMTRLLEAAREESVDEGHPFRGSTTDLGLDTRSVTHLARMLGVEEPAHAVDHLEPEALRRAIHDAMINLIRTAAAREPIALVVEDLHWADPSSIDLTTELMRTCPDSALLVYVTGRHDARSTFDRLTAESDAKNAIDLDPLEPAQIEQLAKAFLGDTPPQNLITILIDRSAGNPLFAEELIRSMQDSGALARSPDNQWTLREDLSHSVPPTIEGVLSARLDLLPVSSVKILQAAAVIGRRVRMPLLSAVLADSVDLKREIDSLIGGGFFHRSMDEKSTLVFHHALVQEAAYGRLVRNQREALHRQAAQAVEELYGTGDDQIDALARHLYLGNGGRKAIDFLLLAARRSRRLYANAEAIEHLTRAIQLIRTAKDTEGRVHELLLELADLHGLCGNYLQSIQMYEEIRSESDDAAAYVGLASILRRRGEYDRAIAIVDEALARRDVSVTDASSLWLERGWSLSTAGRIDEATKSLRAGVEVASNNNSSVRGHLLLQLARTHNVHGELDLALAQAQQAVSIFEAVQDVRGSATALRILGDAYAAQGDLEKAAEVLEEGLAVAERVGSVEEIGGCLINLGLVDLKRGRLMSAAGHTRRAIAEFERVGNASGRAVGYSNMAFILADAGELDEAFACGEAAILVAEQSGNILSQADGLQALASILLRRREFAAAASHASAAADLFEQVGAVQEAAECRKLAEAGIENRSPDA